MIKLEQYLRRHVTRYFALFFIVLYLVTNGVIIVLNTRYINRTNTNQNDSFIQMVEHLIKETDHASALTFIEHYGHTHNVYLTYTSKDNLYTHQTETKPSEGREVYDVIVDGNIVGTMVIDNIDSTLTEGNTLFLVTVNGVLLLVFVGGLVLLGYQLKQQHLMIMNDLKGVQLTIEQIRSETEYQFHDFYEIHQVLNETLTHLDEAKLSHKKHIQALAHDIKTPLTIIKASVEGVHNKRLILDRTMTDSLLDEVNTINDHVQRIMQDADSETVTPYAVSNEIKKTIEQFIPLCQKNNIGLQYNIASGVTVSSRPRALARVLDHLMQNIITHAQAAHAYIELTNTHLIVKDDGIGIDKATLEAIQSGQPMHQDKASGFGLSIVKDTLDSMNASLSIESKTHEGTTFIITFHS